MPQNVARLVRRVERGFIRVDADEVTYPLHVILRTRLERALLSGDLAVAELPGAWNDGFNALFGITPPDDRRGCLQDIHWYDGAIGYFPTYTLGAMAAAQIFAAASKADPGITDAIGRGDLRPLASWLRAQVHGHGSSLSSDAILVRATGRSLDPVVFQQHLKTRYLS
jgi:carboxypeptidase Taq